MANQAPKTMGWRLLGDNSLLNMLFCKRVAAMTLRLKDKHGRKIHSKKSGEIVIYSVNSLLTVLVKKDYPIDKVIEILNGVPDE